MWCCAAGDLYSDRLDNSNWRRFCWHWPLRLMNVTRPPTHTIDRARCWPTIHAAQSRRAGTVSAEPVDVHRSAVAMVAAATMVAAVIRRGYSWHNNGRVLDYRNQIRHCVCVCVRANAMVQKLCDVAFFFP